MPPDLNPIVSEILREQQRRIANESKVKNAARRAEAKRDAEEFNAQADDGAVSFNLLLVFQKN